MYHSYRNEATLSGLSRIDAGIIPKRILTQNDTLYQQMITHTVNTIVRFAKENLSCPIICLFFPGNLSLSHFQNRCLH